jgi:hypothetical protein
VSGLIDLQSRERRQDIYNPKKKLKISLSLFDGQLRPKASLMSRARKVEETKTILQGAAHFGRIPNT